MCHKRFASTTLFGVGVSIDDADSALRPCNRVAACGEYCVGPKGFVSASACIMFPAMCANLTMPS